MVFATVSSDVCNNAKDNGVPSLSASCLPFERSSNTNVSFSENTKTPEKSSFVICTTYQLSSYGPPNIFDQLVCLFRRFAIDHDLLAIHRKAFDSTGGQPIG